MLRPAATPRERAALTARAARQAVSGGAQRAILGHAARRPRCQAVAGAGAARCAPPSRSRPRSQAPPEALAQSAAFRARAPAPAGAAGAPAGACAWRWLQVQGAAATRVSGAAAVHGIAERLSLLRLCLPALERLCSLQLAPHPDAAPAAARASLVGVARAVGRCARLRQLDVRFCLDDKPGHQLPDALGGLLADARALEELALKLEYREPHRREGPAPARVSALVTGLAGLSRLRALTLDLPHTSTDAPLPACLSRLAQLTSLRLSGIGALRCAPGWARLPALARLELEECVFASGDGEDVLPGMGALAALTGLHVTRCPSLRVLPASLWRLARLRSLSHNCKSMHGVARAALPVAGLPAGGAPCFASLTHLTLAGHNLQAFPPGVLAMRRLTRLDLSCSCFSEVPQGITMLTALEALHLGRTVRTGGRSGATLMPAPWATCRAFQTWTCCSSRTAACSSARAWRPRLLTPACGCCCSASRLPPAARRAWRSWAVRTRLLQRARTDVLFLAGYDIDGAGRRDARNFCAALQAVGFPLSDAGDTDGEQRVGGARVPGWALPVACVRGGGA